MTRRPRRRPSQGTDPTTEPAPTQAPKPSRRQPAPARGAAPPAPRTQKAPVAHKAPVPQKTPVTQKTPAAPSRGNRRRRGGEGSPQGPQSGRSTAQSGTTPGTRDELARRAGLEPTDERIVAGRLTVHPRGFGFLRLDGGGADLFVPPPMGQALDGDRILVLRTDEPRVLGVLERTRRLAAGVWDAPGKVIPDDPKLPSPVTAAPGAASPRRGDKVVLDLTTSPYEVTVVVGRAGDEGVDEKAALAEAEIEPDFPRDVLREAKALGDDGVDRMRDRVDLRGDRAIVTIDPVSSRDFDDAISLARTSSGWRLGVHIADVAAYVAPGSALDREARRRGTSVYLPSRVIPMLPERLSNDLCSLREGEDRLTKSVIFEVSRDGETRSTRVIRSIIRPFRRLTYERASRVMEGAEGEHPDVAATLRAMRELADLMGARRRDSLTLERPEVDFTYDAGGRIVSVADPSPDCAHSVVEEFMVAANAVVGRFLHDRGEPCLWRSHGQPASMDNFVEFTRRLGIPYRPKDSLGTYLRKIGGRPEVRLVVQELLWAMPAADYRPDAPGHFALGLPYYLHFTSPIRRYADMQVHRAVDRVLGHDTPRDEDLALLGRHLSIRERAAASVEGRLRHRRVLDYLADQDRGPHQGVVTQIQRDGLKVELTRFLVWGLLPFAALPGGSYERDDLSAQNESRLFRVGDRLHVTVTDVDRRTGRLTFHPLD